MVTGTYWHNSEQNVLYFAEVVSKYFLILIIQNDIYIFTIMAWNGTGDNTRPNLNNVDRIKRHLAALRQNEKTVPYVDYGFNILVKSVSLIITSLKYTYVDICLVHMVWAVSIHTVCNRYISLSDKNKFY